MEISKSAYAISYEGIIEGPDKRQDKQKAETSGRGEVPSYLERFRTWGEDRRFLHRDLEIAKRVQNASFQQHPAVIQGLEHACFYKPAHTIGGDYYDFLPLEDGVWGVAVGDVSGKGISAALLMATLQASLRSQALRPRSSIETLLRNTNRLLRDSSPTEFFASLFYAEYQPASRVLTYVNAGHTPPMVVRRSHGLCNVFMLHAGGAPVGAFETSRYRSASLQLEPGDLLVAYTDGITELEDPEGEPFGQGRLETLLCSCGVQDPQEVLRTILDQLSAYSPLCSQADDMTLVVMRVDSQ